MASTDRDLLLDVLRAAYGAAPEALYPARFAQERGIDRVTLDHALDQLRLGGLVRLTEWVQGLGQGYTLTQAGMAALENPHALAEGPPRPAARLRLPEPYDDEPPARRGLIIRPVKPVVSWSLIAANVAVFLATATPAQRAEGLGARLFHGGKLFSGAVLRGHEWWRLLTYAYLHADILHIFFNMYFLYSLGPIMEAMWGSARTLLLYLVSAITGGCVVVWLNRVDAAGLPIATVGASGALCGLLASLGVWVMLNREHLPPALYATLSRNVMINIALIAFMSFAIENVSWEGHLGGALGGAIASFPLQWSRYGDNWVKRLLGCVGTVLVAVAFIVLMLSRSMRPPGA